MRVRFFVILQALVVSICGCGNTDADSKEESSADEQHSAIDELQGVIDDYVREVVEEAKDVRVIYTDGAFDDDIRREAKRRGIELEPISMMAGNGPLSLKMAVEKGDDVALQLGFDLWKRDGKELPLCSGVLARPRGMPEGDQKRGIAAAERLGDRILELYEQGVVKSVSDKKVRERFECVQWRIARIARMRAERADGEGRTLESLKDVNISDRLDHYNAGLKQILHDMAKVRERTLSAVTPREALQLALARADFTHARSCAEPILKDDPEDPDANFAVGMSYYTQKQWARAEEYLCRCLIKKPRQVAVWNNLGMVYMQMGRYEEGLKCAKRALEICPDSAEVKDTIKQIETARDKAEARKR